jgi:hypothetical protein
VSPWEKTICSFLKIDNGLSHTSLLKKNLRLKNRSAAASGAERSHIRQL